MHVVFFLFLRQCLTMHAILQGKKLYKKAICGAGQMKVTSVPEDSGNDSSSDSFSHVMTHTYPFL